MESDFLGAISGGCRGWFRGDTEKGIVIIWVVIKVLLFRYQARAAQTFPARGHVIQQPLQVGTLYFLEKTTRCEQFLPDHRKSLAALEKKWAVKGRLSLMRILSVPLEKFYLLIWNNSNNSTSSFTKNSFRRNERNSHSQIDIVLLLCVPTHLCIYTCTLSSWYKGKKCLFNLREWQALVRRSTAAVDVALLEPLHCFVQPDASQIIHIWSGRISTLCRGVPSAITGLARLPQEGSATPLPRPWHSHRECRVHPSSESLGLYIYVYVHVYICVAKSLIFSSLVPLHLLWIVNSSAKSMKPSSLCFNQYDVADDALKS